MIRLFSYAALILVFAVGAAWFADHPGTVKIDFVQWQVETSFAFLGLVITSLMALAAFTIWLMGYLSREMPIMGSNRVIKRQRRGLLLLNRSMIALTSGDSKLARTLVEEAEVLLPPQPLVTMIAAEAATRMGDTSEAAKRFDSLRQSADGKLIGLRGLAQQAQASGKAQEALLLAREALTENAQNPWAMETIFTLEVKAADWDAALETLKKLEKHKVMDLETVTHHRATLYFSKALELKLAGDLTEALDQFKKAVKERPSFTEAQLALVRAYADQGQSGPARKQLTKAWGARPHKALRDQLLDLNPTATTAASLLSIRELVSLNPDHSLSKLIISEALTRDGQGDAAEVLMTKVRDKMGLNPHEVVPDDSSFQCMDCGFRQEKWSLTCDHCHTFNSLKWFDAFDPSLTTLKPVKQSSAPASVLMMMDQADHEQALPR